MFVFVSSTFLKCCTSQLGLILFRNKDQSDAEIFKTSNIWVSFNRHISIIIHPLKAPRLLNYLFFKVFKFFKFCITK